MFITNCPALTDFPNENRDFASTPTCEKFRYLSNSGVAGQNKPPSVSAIHVVCQLKSIKFKYQRKCLSPRYFSIQECI
ncbi:hypothetical protein QE152_g40115 [Popillia japonica]|uniref:Uncharacterized protein n=1 Tax=Popillia japonica TaxID=7064 RepID=A0AAW1HSB0_POPJA